MICRACRDGEHSQCDSAWPECACTVCSPAMTLRQLVARLQRQIDEEPWSADLAVKYVTSSGSPEYELVCIEAKEGEPTVYLDLEAPTVPPDDQDLGPDPTLELKMGVDRIGGSHGGER